MKTAENEEREAVGMLAGELVCFVHVEGLFQVYGSPALYDGGDGCVKFDPVIMDLIRIEFGTDATFAIVAHELGHRLQDMHGEKFTQEGADFVAGCALARSGRPVTPFLDFLKKYDAGPPSFDARAAATLAGAEYCAHNMRAINWIGP